LATRQEPIELVGIKRKDTDRVITPKKKLFAEQDDPMFWLAVVGGIVVIALFLKCFGVF